jgi:hypothetical protein
LIATARRRSPDEALIAEPNATIARQMQFLKTGAFEKFMAADNEFHAQLYEAACAGCTCLPPARHKTSSATTS